MARRPLAPDVTRIDLLVDNAREVLTLQGPDGETKGPRRGEALGHLGAIPDGAVAIDKGRIAAVGAARDLAASFEPARRLDARGGIVLPGFVDTHTHLAWAGSRAWELDWKVQGRSYQEITKAGGGIPYTVRETRKAAAEELTRLARGRLSRALAAGTTTIEAKSGYGLSEASELLQIDAIAAAEMVGAPRVYRTYLGLHEKPPEHATDPGPYLDEIRTSTLAKLKRKGGTRFVDAFVETGVFTPDDVRPVLTEAKRLGFDLRIHADEFTDLGGARFAVEMGARSADHLLSVSDDGIEALASSDTTATLLPLVPFAIRRPTYAPARRLVDAGCIVGLATDFNPNVPCLSMETVIQHAVYGMGLRPQEALVAATVNAGHSLDPQAGHGVLAAGHPADLVVADVPDATHLAYGFGTSHVRAVVAAGRVVREA